MPHRYDGPPKGNGMSSQYCVCLITPTPCFFFPQAERSEEELLPHHLNKFRTSGHIILSQNF